MFTTIIAIAFWEFLCFGFYQVMLEKVEDEIKSQSTTKEKAKVGMALGALSAGMALLPLAFLL